MKRFSKEELEKKSKEELIDEVINITRERKRLEKEKEKLEKKQEKLKRDYENLKAELRKYKNPNTPPSAHPHLKPFVQSTKTPGKRGAPMDHPGTNRPKKPADETRYITTKECPGCQSQNLKLIGQKKQQIEELPPDIKPNIIDVCRDIFQCLQCNLKFTSKDGKTPLQGKFGTHIIVLVLFLKFIVRGVLRKTTTFLDASFTLKLAPASIQAIITRAADAAENEYTTLKQRIRTARILYIDETSFSVLGKNWWVWAFRSDTDLLIVIRNSRGNNVLEEILKKMYNGIVVCDGWRAYDFLSNAQIQRCWAHLLRKSKELTTIPGTHLHEKLTKLFDEIKEFNSQERTEKQRTHKYEQMTTKLKKLTTYYGKYEECLAITKYINFRINQWFTCIRLAGIEPTNNYAEQAIRETVLIRKIIGAFRSETGTQVYETLASLFATWQIQKKDIKQELHQMLTKNLC
jgi:hypothetical protein